MEVWEYFATLKDLLEKHDVGAIKLFVTSNPLIVRNEDGEPIANIVCEYMRDDDPELLLFFVALGVRFGKAQRGSGVTPMHILTKYKPRSLRALIDLGFTFVVADGGGQTPLEWACVYRAVSCVWELLDAGARFDQTDFLRVPPNWAFDMETKRDDVRKKAIICLGLPRVSKQQTRNGIKDVVRIIARCVWSARFRGI